MVLFVSYGALELVFISWNFVIDLQVNFIHQSMKNRLEFFNFRFLVFVRMVIHLYFQFENLWIFASKMFGHFAKLMKNNHFFNSVTHYTIPPANFLAIYFHYFSETLLGLQFFLTTKRFSTLSIAMINYLIHR